MSAKVHCEPADIGTESAAKGTRQVFLVRVLQDAYEYHGVTRLAQLLVFYTIGLLVIYHHWGDSAAMFKTSVVQSFKSNRADWQPTQLWTMESGWDYMTGYLQQAVTESQGRQSPHEHVYVTEYNRIKFARLVINLEMSCLYSLLLCHHTDMPPPSFNATWEPLQGAGKNWLHGMSNLQAVTVVSPNSTYNDMQAMLDGLLTYRGYISKYAYLVSLELVIGVDIENEDSFFVAVTQQRSGDRRGGTSLDATPPAFVTAFTIKHTLYTTRDDMIRMVVELMFVICVMLGWCQEWQQFQLALWQYHYNIQRTPRSKAEVAWRYMSNLWNLVDLISLLFSTALIAAYLLIARMIMSMQGTDVTAGSRELDAVMGVMVQYSGFLYGCIFNNFLIGVRLYQYMKIHKGLRIYYNLFIRAFRCLKDFAVFFVSVLVLLGTSMLAFFQIVGGNPHFVNATEGMSTMAQLTFGYFDYHAFKNDDMGLGSWGAITTVVFWLAVVLLVVISQNVILAIFSSAYDEAQRSEGEVEMTLLTVAVLRCIWHAKCIWWCITHRQHTRAFAKHILGSHKGNRSMMDKAFCAWAVAYLPETYTLLAYFMDYISFTLYRRSPWQSNPGAPKAVVEDQGTWAWAHKATSPSESAFMLRDETTLRDTPFTEGNLWKMVSHVGDHNETTDNHLLEARTGLLWRTKQFVWEDPLFMVQAILDTYGTNQLSCTSTSSQFGTGADDRRATLEDRDACVGVTAAFDDSGIDDGTGLNEVKVQVTAMQERMHLLLQLASAQAEMILLQTLHQPQEVASTGQGRARAALPAEIIADTDEGSDDSGGMTQPHKQHSLAALARQMRVLIKQAQLD